MEIAELAVRVVRAGELSVAKPDDTRPLIVLVKKPGTTLADEHICATFADPARRPLLADVIAALIFLHPEDRAACAGRWASVEPIESTFAFVVPWQPPPITGHRDDGEVRSFLAPYSACIAPGVLGEDVNDWCYRTAQAVLAGPPVATITVIQRPEPAPPESSPPRSTTMIIPHRGPLELLETCLAYVHRQTRMPDAVQVVFDEPIEAPHARLMRRYPAVSWMQTDPAGVGPYVPRQLLADAAATKTVVFQDSDDVPCRNRVATLASAHDGADMLGSHELRIDELTGKVRAIRFPLDVTAALTIRPNHSLFHPTSAVTASSFRRSGGFSTNRRFASDVQFLLRAFFLMDSIRNVDAFLYIRRKRHGSLTTSAETHMQSPLRLELTETWCDAFKAVRDNGLPLADSALAIEHRPGRATVVPVE